MRAPVRLELVVRGVEHLEALPDQLLALGTEHLQHLAVAVDHQAVARQHHAHRRARSKAVR